MARPEFKRRAALLDDFVFEGEVAEAAADAVEGHQLVGELLHVDAVGEVVEGDRSGPDVAQPLQGIEGPALALFSKGVGQIERAVGVAHAQSAQQHAVDGHLHQFGHDVVRQLDGVDELAAGFKSACVHDLHEQAHQVELVDSRGRNVCGLGGNAMQKSIEHTLVNGSDGHQVVAQAAAVGSHMLKRLWPHLPR